jgi:hypothetical protein
MRDQNLNSRPTDSDTKLDDSSYQFGYKIQVI